MNYIDIIRKYAENKSLEIYMVGGAVRDMFMKRTPSDYDFAVNGDCHSTARDIAEILNGSYVNMHSDVARVVVDKTVLDFTNLRGFNIYEDLKNRDFTINALAIDLKNFEIIDITGGIEDIEKGVVRFVSNSAACDDPLRMVRAVRFASRLGFTIDEDTAEIIRDKAYLLDIIPGERILEELYKIFESDRSHVYIKKLDELNLLERIFPIIRPMKKLGKCRYHVADAYTHSLLTLKFFEENISSIFDTEHGGKIKNHLDENINGRKRIYTIKIGVFLHDIGKPKAVNMDGGIVSFRGHEKTGVQEFKEIAKRLAMSIKQREIIKSIIAGHMRILGLFKQGASDRALYRLFADLQDNTIDVLLCSLYDITATRSLLDEDGESRKYSDFILNLIDGYYRYESSRKKFLTGRDIMDITGAEGSRIGKLLKMVEEQAFYGNIKTREDAVNFVKRVGG